MAQLYALFDSIIFRARNVFGFQCGTCDKRVRRGAAQGGRTASRVTANTLGTLARSLLEAGTLYGYNYVTITKEHAVSLKGLNRKAGRNGRRLHVTDTGRDSLKVL